MSTVPSVRKAAAGRSLLISGVDWSMYSRLLRIFADWPGIRLTYDRGELEIMSPILMEHEDDGHILGLFVVVLAEELGLTLKFGGSTTMRRRKRKQGIESDECYWIANAPRMAGRRRLDLRIDPPPDLAIEVDVTRSSLNRMGIYAALKVPEVWRLDGDVLTFQLLDEHGVYQPGAKSGSFPLVTPADVLPFLREARQAGDELPVLRRFRAWVRERLATPPPAIA
jgi:Uma2 family endonuclease